MSFVFKVADISVMDNDSYVLHIFSHDNRVAESETALADMHVGFD